MSRRHPITGLRIPATRPSWSAGNYAVIVDGEHAGYFRQFRSAWLWRQYLVAAKPDAALIYIHHRGAPVSRWSRSEQDAVVLP